MNALGRLIDSLKIFSADAATVHIKNTTASVVVRGGVLGIDGPLIDPTTNASGFFASPRLKGVAPTADHAASLAILQRPLAAGAIGPAVVSGVVPCVVDITNAGHRFAGVKAGDTSELASGVVGPARILWAESGTGAKKAVVSIGPWSLPLPTHIRAIVDEASGVGEGDGSIPIGESATIVQPAGAAWSTAFPAPTTIPNRGWAIDDGGGIDAIYDETAAAWRAIQADCLEAQ